MAHTFGKASARATSSANPSTTSAFAVEKEETVLVLMIKIVGGTDRTGGAPTFAGATMTQASTAQKAATSPEGGCELWYLLEPPIGSYTASIPNAGSLTLFYTLASGKAKPGSGSAYDGATGTNNTSTNPDPGAIITTQDGDIGFAICASGAQSWGPSAQAGTVIANSDDGTNGGGEQYHLQATAGTINLNWTFGTSDDWGAVAVYFKEVPAVGLNNYLSVKSESGVSVSQ